MPRPVAIANGKLATRPKTIVMTPATSAVTAATCGTESVMPSTSRFADGLVGSRLPRISGLRTTM